MKRLRPPPPKQITWSDPVAPGLPVVIIFPLSFALGFKRPLDRPYRFK